ncbi:hypothetical protein IFM89_013333 [Coptis chinensis]|uniref:Replication factor A C-terminal domain-containing protein n=1 Tax=Coptis chinensis TaxID=261450 RepID=A0A835LRE9_9MAGN|nr:hypothetical protein IFM89_013333 [Coptis chinensis]
MRITLWENGVDLVDKDIINSTVDQPVVPVTSLIVDIYNGVYYLNSRRATKIYYNLEIPELKHLMNSRSHETITVPTVMTCKASVWEVIHDYELSCPKAGCRKKNVLEKDDRYWCNSCSEFIPSPFTR